MSDDGTRKIIKSYQYKFSNFKIIDNPEFYVPSGFNRILSIAKGDIIIRVDGHAEIENNYISNCLKVFNDVNAECVGGSIRHKSNNKFGEAIKIAQSSKFGSGGANFRGSIIEGKYVKTLAFGAYKRKVFKILGGYDEELIRNQDDEFNFRMLQSDMKLWLDPSINSTYYSRDSFTKLFKQYFGYGKYKVRVIQKRRGIASFRHVIPMLFLLSIILGVFLLVYYNNLILISFSLGVYLIACVLSTLSILKRQKYVEKKNIINKYFNIFTFLIPLSYIIMHFSYGAGFLVGLINYFNKWNDTEVKDYHFNSKFFGDDN